VVDNDPLPSIDAFSQKLEQARKPREPGSTSEAGMALRMGSEFAAGVLVGAGLGLLLDRWFDTSPIFLILCLLFGTAGGVRLMMYTVKSHEKHPQQEQEQKQEQE
jgi:ATP synthase protein I